MDHPSLALQREISSVKSTVVAEVTDLKSLLHKVLESQQEDKDKSQVRGNEDDVALMAEELLKK